MKCLYQCFFSWLDYGTAARPDRIFSLSFFNLGKKWRSWRANTCEVNGLDAMDIIKNNIFTALA